MRQPYSTLTSAHVRACALELLPTVLPTVPQRRGCTATTLYALLLTAAVCACSFAAVCRRRRLPCSRETARRTFLGALPADRQDLQQQLVQALRHTVPPGALRRRRGCDLAFDLHQRAFYGKKTTPGILGGEEHNGTNYFWTYASAVLLHRGRRWTLGLVAVTSGRLEECVDVLVTQVRAAGVTIRKVLMDKGFHSGPVVRCLKEHRIPFLFPLQVRGQRLQRLQQRPTGTRYRYRWQPRHADYRVEVHVTVLRKRQRRRQRQVVVMLLACWGLKRVSARWLGEIYRRRFGIEASYRQLGQGLALSASTDARVRLLWVGLALLLRNVWVLLHWRWLSEARRGGRLLHGARLPLLQMLEWLDAALHEILPPLLELQIPRELELTGNLL